MPVIVVGENVRIGEDVDGNSLLTRFESPIACLVVADNSLLVLLNMRRPGSTHDRRNSSARATLHQFPIVGDRESTHI